MPVCLPSTPFSRKCDWCRRFNRYYGWTDGWCVLCWQSWGWSVAENRLRAIARRKTGMRVAMVSYRNVIFEHVLLSGPIQAIVLEYLGGFPRGIRREARVRMWHRLLLGNVSECSPSSNFSNSNAESSDSTPENSDEQRASNTRRALGSCQNPLWKLEFVNIKSERVRRRNRMCGNMRRGSAFYKYVAFTHVIYLVIDFLGVGTLPHHNAVTVI